MRESRTSIWWRTTSTALLALGLAGGAFVGLARSSRDAQPFGALWQVSAIQGQVTQLAPRLTKAGIDRAIRGEDGASDHAPAWIVLT